MIKGKCDFCEHDLKAPCWIRRCQPSYPFHLNPGGLYRYCSQECYDSDIRIGQIAGGQLQKVRG